MFKKRSITAELFDTILLFTIVIILAVFSFFMMGTANRNQPLETIHINGNESNSEEPTIIENKRLEEVIQELKWEGCKIVFVEPRVYLDNPNYVSYEEYKSKAIETNLVIVTPSESGTILLVQNQKNQWVWIPS